MEKNLALTADQHDADGEDFLGVGVGRDVAEADAGETAEGEVERRDVLRVRRRPALCVIDVRLVRLSCQLVQPADLRAVLMTLHVADRVPNARQPMSDERE